MWMLPQRTWYTGITNLARSGGKRQHLPGVAARYRDHVSNTFKESHLRPETRYKIWKHARFWDTAFIIYHKDTRQEALALERRTINELQAPIQDRVRQGHIRPLGLGFGLEKGANFHLKLRNR